MEMLCLINEVACLDFMHDGHVEVLIALIVVMMHNLVVVVNVFAKVAVAEGWLIVVGVRHPEVKVVGHIWNTILLHLFVSLVEGFRFVKE